MKRLDCLKTLASLIQNELVVVTLGVTRDEWLMLRPEGGTCSVGMGIPTPFGLGLALALPRRKVVVMESDGSLLFGLNTLATVAVENPRNLMIVVFDNECYESVGGAPSHTSRGVDLAAMARGAGFKYASTVRNLEQFQKEIEEGIKRDALSLIVVKIEVGIADVPGQYFESFDARNRFVRYVEETENISVLRPSKKPRRDPSTWGSS